MNLRLPLIFLFLLFTYTSHSQTDKEILMGEYNPDTLLVIDQDTLNMKRLIMEYTPSPPRWTKVNKAEVNLSEIAFVNWNAGGNNSVTTLAKTEFNRKYKTRNIQWTTELIMRYGLNIQEGQGVRKSDDAIQLNSTFGAKHDALSSWYMTAKGNFLTQFTNGYRYPDNDNPISRFMAPGYLFLGVGAEYDPEGKDFTLYFSPLTHKSTFVLDQDLADAGSFGVKPAVYDALGNKVRDGQRVLTEVGILITSSFQTKLDDNIFFANKLGLYTDYLNSFGNIDINWVMDFEFRVNEYIKASLGTHIIYDNDVKFKEEVTPEGETIPYGARIQFKQLLGIGAIYNF